MSGGKKSGVLKCFNSKICFHSRIKKQMVTILICVCLIKHVHVDTKTVIKSCLQATPLPLQVQEFPEIAFLDHLLNYFRKERFSSAKRKSKLFFLIKWELEG